MDKPRILIIDSSPFTLAANREAFKKAGFEVQTLASIANAAYWWETFRPHMLVLNGETMRRELDEFQEIQQQGLPSVLFLLVVGYKRSEHLLHKGAFQNFEFLEKGLPPSLLVKKLRLFLKSRRRRRAEKVTA